MFNRAMKDIYHNHICKDQLIRHTLRMTCRQLRLWIPVDPVFVRKIRILLGLQEDQEFAHKLMQLYDNHPYLGITPYQCKSHLVTQPRRLRIAAFSFTVNEGYQIYCDYMECVGLIPSKTVICTLFGGDDDDRILDNIIDKDFAWMLSYDAVSKIAYLWRV